MAPRPDPASPPVPLTPVGSSTGAPPARRGGGVWAGAAIIVLGLATGAWGIWLVARGRPTPPAERPRGEAPADPRLSYAGPFRNVRPEVRHVGSAACAACHPAETRAFARHPMGRSLTPIEHFASPPEDRAHHNPFEALGRTFRIVRDANRVLHRQEWTGGGASVPPLDLPADYAIGSGTRGYSFVTVREGYVFQTPISWYSQKNLWDLSPGFGPEMALGRPVTFGCLFCHANRVQPRPGSLNRYDVPVFQGHAIGCERCHGPGQIHVAERRPHEPSGAEVDHSIVNPRYLPWRLREAVCEQCHLGGVTRVPHLGRSFEDFRPGLPLEAILSVYLLGERVGEGHKAVSQVEQMYASRCFRASPEERKLGCISCHDPHRHVGPEARADHYRRRCLRCHKDHGCTEPPTHRLGTTPPNDCVQCHMPRFGTADVPHTAATDHRILRRKGEATEVAAGPTEGDSPLVSFYRDRIRPDDPEARRDLGVALVQVESRSPALAARHAPRAVRLLEAALRQHPDDLVAWEKKARALMRQHRLPEALAAVESVLARAPDREVAVAAAGHIAQEMGQLEPALAYWRRAIALNPWAANYRLNLVRLLAHKRAWAEASRACDELLRLDPGRAEVRKVRVECLLHTGRPDEARAEFDRLRALRPPDLAELERWYAGQSP